MTNDERRELKLVIADGVINGLCGFLLLIICAVGLALFLGRFVVPLLPWI